MTAGLPPDRRWLEDSARLMCELRGYRQPRPPKPHVMRLRGRWYLVDPPMGTWVQDDPITTDPRGLS